MKLLTKKEIDQRKAAEQTREVDEGRKLAKSIASLREIRANEEASLERFRRENVTKIHEEITKYAEERNALAKEVGDLKKEREELKKPLDEEWERLEEERGIFIGERNECREHEKQLDIRDEMLAKRSRDLDNRDTELAILLREALEIRENSQKEREESGKILESSRSVLERATAQKQEIEKDLAERTERLIRWEKNLTLLENKNKERSQELEKEWKLLNDRKARLDKKIS